GDPFLFGRGGEEAEALAKAQIPFEVIPGVTAALGAGAFAGIPLTHRGVSSAVAIVTGHEDPAAGDCERDWHALAQFPGTLVIYMGLARLAAIARTLVEFGRSAETPAAAIRCATTGQHQTVTGTLGTIAEAAETTGLRSPTLIIIGPVVSLRSTLSWFD